MNLITVPRSIAKFQYATIRFPLNLVERNVFAHYLPEDAPVRLSFERALGSLDSVAGRILGDPSIGRRGEALSHRADFLEKATTLETKAEARRSEAEQKLRAEEEAAHRAKQEAERQRTEEVAAARRDEQQAKDEARQKAQARAKANKAQADREATQRVQAAENAKQAEHRRIAAQEKRTTVAPKQALADANKKQDAAQQQRDQADRLAKRAAAERKQRQNS